MKKAAWIFILFFQCFSLAATPATKAKKKTKKTQSATPVLAKMTDDMVKRLSAVLQMARSGQCEKAVPSLYVFARRSEFESEKYQIKYILGSCLLELNLNQVAAFQFVDIIRNGDTKYTQQAIERLSIAADRLGDETLLNYAISRVNVADYPEHNRDLVWYRLGEMQMKAGKFAESAQSFARVPSSSRYHTQAKFDQGLSYLESNKTSLAIPIFNELLAESSGRSVVDNNRVLMQLSIARALYQAKEWDESVAAYREIPRDSEYWHDALFESSWALFRSAKFRSVLSNFQSLHSAYYEDKYIPESLLLRGIVYLYICKFDELEKVIQLFEKTYQPVLATLDKFNQINSDPLSYFSEIQRVNLSLKGQKTKGVAKLPYSVVRHILNEGDVNRSFQYLRNLVKEKMKIEESLNLRRTHLGAYGVKVLQSRIRNSKLAVGEMVKVHLANMRTELRNLTEQIGFLHYEMINGRKEVLKKKIAGKNLDVPSEEHSDRTFYVKNGYEYWPFDGEYWLDEIGNYHYLGKQSCE